MNATLEQNTDSENFNGTLVPHDITDKRFLSAGFAIFTVENNKGQHYTFRIAKGREDNSPFFAGVLTGSDNTRSYTYIGLFSPETLEIRLTKKSRYTDDTIPVKVLRWVMEIFNGKRELPLGYAIHHLGYCCRCGRPLSTPESVKNGIGPICAGKAGWEM